MIIYNITMQVDWAVHDQWKEWLVSEYLPAFINTGLFSHYQLNILLEVNEEDGPTYAVQLYAKSAAQVYEFRELFLEEFQQRERTAWGDHAYSFGTIMQVIN